MNTRRYDGVMTARAATQGTAPRCWGASRVSAAPIVSRVIDLLRVTRATMRLAYEYFLDFTVALKHSAAVVVGQSQEKLGALITIGYHGIEKGLALPEPRPGFGHERVALLISRLERYVRLAGFDRLSLLTINVLREYWSFNRAHGLPDSELRARFELLSRNAPPGAIEPGVGGCKLVHKQEFLRDARLDLERFFASRSSARQFSSDPVAMSDIVTAVQFARKTPSCCNRQPGKVWVLRRKSEILKALRIQGGARGFEHEIPILLIITSDIACFQSAGERNQAFIDGGMFAMSVIYALHSLGLVSCCLNWSKTHKTDRLLRREVPIPTQDRVILLLAVGHPKERFLVAQSQRRDIHEILRVVD